MQHPTLHTALLHGVEATAQAIPKQCDVCIVGAGVAGSALAWYLGSRGRRVAIIERDLTEPEKFIGELLQPGGVQLLREMGYTDVLEGFDAQLVKGYALFMEGRHFNIPYPSGTTGRGFRYGKFINSLRSKLKCMPNVHVVEGTVEQVAEREKDSLYSKVTFKLKEDRSTHQIESRLTIVSDGCFSKFRKELNGVDREVNGFMVGMLLNDVQLPFPGHGHVFMHGDQPVLAYPVTNSSVRILVDFKGTTPPKQRNNEEQYMYQMGHSLPKNLQHVYWQALEHEKFKAMPTMRISGKSINKPSLMAIGDALNVRHPLTGGGMTAALTDVKLLGDLLLGIENFEEPEAIDLAVKTFFDTRHQNNATINILADALYGVMTSDALKKACFNYMFRGPQYAEGPISILSAVSRDQKLLVSTFFDVAAYGAVNIIKSDTSLKGIKQAFKLYTDAFNIIHPLMMSEHPDLLTRTWLVMGRWMFPSTKK